METGKPAASLAKLLLLFIPAAGLHLLAISALSDPDRYPKFLLLCLLVGLLWSAIFFQKNGTESRRTTIHWALLALAAVVTLSLAWARTPMEGLPTAAGWWLSFWLFAGLLRFDFGTVEWKEWLPRFMGGMLLVLAVYALTKLAFAIQVSGFTHQTTYAVTGPFAHRNLLSHVLVLCLPMAMLLIFREKRLWRVIGSAALLSGTAALLLLLVRSSWAAGLVSLLVFGLLALWMLRARALRMFALIMLLASSAAVGGWLVYQQSAAEGDLLQKHAAGMVDGSYGTLRERKIFWQKSLALSQEKPVAGWGAGSWKVEIGGTGLAGIRESMDQGDTFVVRAHNDYLQLLVESGPLAAGLFLLLLVLPFAGVRRLRALSAEDGLWFAALLAGIAGYAVIAAFSFPTERMGSQTILVLYLAAWARIWPGMGKESAAFGQKAVSLIALLMVAGCAWVGIARIRADLYLQAALMARARGDQAALVAALPDHDLWAAPLDGSATPLAWYRGTAELVRGNLPAALTDLELAWQQNPYHPHVLANYAAARVQEGNPDAARELLQQAVLAAPHFDEGWLNLAALEFNTGQIDEAIDYLHEVPLHSSHENYAAFRSAILAGKAQEMYQTHLQHPIAANLYRIRQNADWLKNVFEKALINELKFSQQVILDAIFLLEEQEKSLTLIEIQALYNHYDLN